jgi:hypothetical protein
MAKYNNTKVKNKSGNFDSKLEWKRYCELKILEKANLIDNLSIHPKFLLQQSFTDKQSRTHRKIEYIADFLYYDILKKSWVVEDVKGVKTEAYKIKKKLFIMRYWQYLFFEVTK